MYAGIYVVKPITHLDAINLFKIYGLNSMPYDQSADGNSLNVYQPKTKV